MRRLSILAAALLALTLAGCAGESDPPESASPSSTTAPSATAEPAAEAWLAENTPDLRERSDLQASRSGEVPAAGATVESPFEFPTPTRVEGLEAGCFEAGTIEISWVVRGDASEQEGSHSVDCTGTVASIPLDAPIDAATDVDVTVSRGAGEPLVFSVAVVGRTAP